MKRNILSDTGFQSIVIFVGFIVGVNLLAAWLSGEPIFNLEYWYNEIRYSGDARIDVVPKSLPG
jgi:hypothetical protein